MVDHVAALSVDQSIWEIFTNHERRIRIMRTLPIILLSLLIGGCSGMNRVPMFELQEHGGGQGDFMKTTSDVHAFAPTTQSVVIETCPYRVPPYAESKGLPDLYDFLVEEGQCVSLSAVQINSTPGYVAALFGPLLQSASIAYAGHAIGRGLGHSGSTNNTSTTTDQTVIVKPAITPSRP